MSERMALLREHLSGKPTPEKWDAVMWLFARWPDNDELPLALEYASSHLETWPDDIRDFGFIPSHSAWSLVRSIRDPISASQLTKKNRTLLKHIKHLSVRELEESKRLATMKHLESLAIVHGDYEELEGLRSLTGLKRLEIGTPLEFDGGVDGWRAVYRFEDLSFLEALEDLEELAILRMSGICSFDPIASLRSVKRLTLSGCQLSSLGTIAGMKQLKRLDLSHSDIESLDGIEAMTSLRELVLFECYSLESLAPLASLPKLKKVVVDGCRAVQSLEGLEHLAGVRKLSLRRMDRLTDISLLSSFTALRELDLAYARKLKNTKPLRDLTELKKLDLRNCAKLNRPPKRKQMRDRDEVEKYLNTL